MLFGMTWLARWEIRMIGNNLFLIRKYQRNESDCQKDGNARVNKPLDAFVEAYILIFLLAWISYAGFWQ